MISSTHQTLFRLNNLNAEQERISYQMSTGKKLQYGSDDVDTFSREVYIEDKIRVYEGLKVQIAKTNAQNAGSDSAIGEAKDLLSYAKVEIIKSLNDTNDDISRQAIAIGLEGVKENLLFVANEQMEGEYLFSGSDTLDQPFSKDPSTGVVTYTGDTQLRKVAVEDGLYRERGVTGFETFLYTSSSALKGDTLTFNETDRIIDQYGNEWKLNTSTNTLDKYELDGDITNPLVTVSVDNTNAPVYTATVPNEDGMKFEAKSNVFNLLDSAINALNKVDSLGNAVSDDVARDALQSSLDEITKAYDGMNNGHAKLGGRNKVFEISYERVSAKAFQYEKLQQDVSGVDLAEVAVEAKALELTYSALYSTINRMNELSLVNFIR